MLSASLLNRLKKTLSKHTRFELQDFDISQSTTKDSVYLKISYVVNSSYYIELRFPFSIGVGAGISISGKLRPGEKLLEETFSGADVQGMLHYISVWQGSLWNELVESSNARLAQEREEQLDSWFKTTDILEKGYYNKSEIEDLKSRLNQVEQQLRDSIEIRFTDQQEQKEAYENLKNDFETLKQSVSMMEKGPWKRSAIVKMSKWTDDDDTPVMLIANGGIINLPRIDEDIEQKNENTKS